MPACLKASDLSKSFGNLRVIDAWNMEISAGERVGIVGPSGCGKTTFLRMAAGLEPPSGGTISGTWKKIAYVFQEPRLIPRLTVKENLSFVAGEADLDEILEITQLSGFESYFPGQLSGGMAQRVNLARALIYEPDFLILDEAFSAYDIDIKYKTILKLVQLWRGQRFAMINVTHNLKDALMLSDRILIVSRAPSRILFEYQTRKSEGFDWFCAEMNQMEAELTECFLRIQSLSAN